MNAGCLRSEVASLRLFAREGGARVFLCLALLAGSPGCAPRPVEPADLVLRGGRVVTVDDARPEAQAVVVLSKDIMKILVDEIPTARVSYTIVGGKIVFSE
jgi:hypothetical protein